MLLYMVARGDDDVGVGKGVSSHELISLPGMLGGTSMHNPSYPALRADRPLHFVELIHRDVVYACSEVYRSKVRRLIHHLPFSFAYSLSSLLLAGSCGALLRGSIVLAGLSLMALARDPATFNRDWREVGGFPQRSP